MPIDNLNEAINTHVKTAIAGQDTTTTQKNLDEVVSKMKATTRAANEVSDNSSTHTSESHHTKYVNDVLVEESHEGPTVTGDTPHHGE